MSDERLVEWLKKDLHKSEHGPSDESLTELVNDAKRLIKLYLERPTRLRPSAVTRELNALARGFEKATKAAEKLGNQGLLMIVAMSEVNQDSGDLDMRPHILYLQRMAYLSRKAAEVSQQHSRSARDHKGGPTPTQELRELVSALMLTYQEVLGIRPIHTVDKISFLAERGFTGFVKEALRLYAPEGVVFEGRLIDKVVEEKLPIRDLKYFDPPLLP
ncbi:hypothetical protein BB934_21485 [Microvirga ossetica]|uniref:Uncharacterized protein n=1 Tax=Microvirga ossetica TaxID=1882682 RepID=A0A1B2EKM0_9HYPH|nr:hypothetical protein [Microvirga ossetica]ANY80489.1 hypothetical protein BB934_21485 [Microvirga ossetica]